MQKFLLGRRGARVVLVVDMTGERKPSHYYQGMVTSVGEGVVMIRDEGMGDLAVACDKVVAVKTLSEAAADWSPPQGEAGFEIER